MKSDLSLKKWLTSHRYNLLPLLHSCPGGVKRELVVSAGTNVRTVLSWTIHLD